MRNGCDSAPIARLSRGPASVWALLGIRATRRHAAHRRVKSYEEISVAAIANRHGRDLDRCARVYDDSLPLADFVLGVLSAAAGFLLSCLSGADPAADFAGVWSSLLGLAASSSLPAAAFLSWSRKSVTYHPLPLSWKPTAEIIFSSDDSPQAGQSRRGSSDIFWITSNS